MNRKEHRRAYGHPLLSVLPATVLLDMSNDAQSVVLTLVVGAPEFDRSRFTLPRPDLVHDVPTPPRCQLSTRLRTACD